jgi:predicted nucleotidyltransferase
MVVTAAPTRAIRLAELQSHAEQIRAIADRYGVSNVRVFGSVARGTATADSDLDLLVDVQPGRGYFDLAGFALDIEDLLGVFTQVATPNGLSSRMRARILADAVPLSPTAADDLDILRAAATNDIPGLADGVRSIVAHLPGPSGPGRP